MSRAEAKSETGFVITGGELGEYAAEVLVPIPDESYLPIGIPTSQLRTAITPARLPDLAYELYSGPYRVAEGPEYVYYPAPRLMHDRSYERWWELLPAAAEFMEGTVRDALVRKDAGELERGVAAAWFRARNMPGGGYWLRPYVKGDGAPYDVSIGCRDCAYIRDPEHFVMRHLAATVSETFVGVADEPPAFAIDYYVPFGDGGYGGLLGFYSPPLEGERGRFWTAGYYYDPDTPFFETTPGFDDAVEQALRSLSPPGADSSLQLNAARTHSLPVGTIAGAVAAAIVALALSGAGAVTARRRIA